MKFEHFSSQKKILERKRPPKSPNSMLFLSIQIFPPNGEHLHHKSDIAETMIWRGSKPVSWCRQAKTHQGKLLRKTVSMKPPDSKTQQKSWFEFIGWFLWKPTSITELSDVLLFDPRLFDFCKFVQNCLKKHASTPKLCDFCLSSQKNLWDLQHFFLGVKKFEILCQHSPKFQKKKYWDVTKQGVKSQKNFSCCTQWIHDCFFLQIVLISLWNCDQTCLWSVQHHILPQTPVRCSIIHKPCCDFGVQQILASVVQFSTLFFLDTLTNHSNLFFVSFSEDTYVNWCWCIWHSKQVLSFEWACSWSNLHQQTLFAAPPKCKLRSRFV